jgi:hypothetical protein
MSSHSLELFEMFDFSLAAVALALVLSPCLMVLFRKDEEAY